MTGSGQSHNDRQAPTREIAFTFRQVMREDAISRRPGLALSLAATLAGLLDDVIADPRDLEPMLTGALAMHETLRRLGYVA